MKKVMGEAKQRAKHAKQISVLVISLIFSSFLCTIKNCFSKFQGKSATLADAHVCIVIGL